MKLTTKNGHDFFVVSSLLQKSLRRGDVTLAATACVELLPKYANYCWNRLLVMSAEDCAASLVTQEIMALREAERQLHKSWKNSHIPAKQEGRIFFAKAIVLLARAKHSRDTDELLHLVVNRIPDEVFAQGLAEVDEVFEVDDGDFEIPDWVYDKHTRRGRKDGHTLQTFLEDEHEALVNASSIFSNFSEMSTTWGYVQPQFDY